MSNFISSITSIVALLVAIIALVYTAKTYLLKSGAQIRGLYSIHSSIFCEDKYVGSLTLENMKDRAIAIFKIYLLVGRNHYIELEDYETNPLILQPFEVYSKQFDPVDFYSINLRRIDLNNLFGGKSIKSRIVLSTGDGRYEVRKEIRRWDPVFDFFRNHMTAIIRPIRSTYKGKAYGGNAKFVVDITTENGKEETLAIYPKDYTIKRFRNFSLSKESLESKGALEIFLNEKVAEGALNCVDISVADMEMWRKEVYKTYGKKVIEARPYGWFAYVILGRVQTISSDIRLRLKNKKMRKAANKKF